MALRFADGGETDLTFLGPADRPGTSPRIALDRSIERWLGTRQIPDAAWLVADAEAPDGVAVDLGAWLAS